MADVPTVLLRPTQVSQMLGVHRVTVWRWVRAEHFPAPVRLGANTVAWRAADVEAWLNDKFDA